MNTKILHTMLIALILIFCISAVQAGDVNITDSDSILTSDDGNIDDLESVDSNNLSTTTDVTSVTDSKNDTELTVNSANIYYKGSFQVTLKDSTANTTLANKVIRFVINNVEYNATTNNNGVAGVDLSLVPGKYSATAVFDGDDTYQTSNNLTLTLQVLSTVKAQDITKYYKGSQQYTATFFDSSGNVLAGKNVVITVNGKSYTRKTDSKGVASLSINLVPGSYKIVSTDPITGYKLTTVFTVLSTISGNNVQKIVADNKKFTAKFLKNNGNVLSGKNIKFKLNGKTYTVKTNTNGKASLSLKNLKKGTYKLVCYNTDGLSKTYTVKVYGTSTTKITTNYYVFFKNNSKTVKATLTNSLGYAPPAGKIIKITINGKTYSKKTNSNGVVSLKLPSLNKGVYTVKYTFAGQTYYKASSASNKVAIITTNNPTLTVKSTTTFGYGAGTQFKVAVTAGNVPLAKRTVVFTVNNKDYTKTTDSNGIASLTINLKIGNYTVKTSVKQDSIINSKSISTDIKVQQRTGTVLTWKSGTSFKDSSQTFKVLLRDINGKALSGQTVKLTIGSKTYSAVTASNGYATIKASASIGIYSVTVKYAGSNSYLPNNTSSSISITASTLIKGVNEKNTISDLSSYLKSSSNCQVGNSKIKTLVNSLTKGLTTEIDKATAIFNYVRDTLSYSFYYNTKYGAVGTLNAKKGNCVDHSHLLVAMFRTAGLAARYVHGTCKFSSGNTYGHVWAQVLIGNTWVCADGTSSKNSLGKISNWNTKSFTLKSTYASLPF